MAKGDSGTEYSRRGRLLGFIGKIYPYRFDEWLVKVIGNARFSDLTSLAQTIADLFNERCGGKPLRDHECTGVHVAGFHPWADGQRRPFFVHVHNGPGHMEVHHELQPIPGGERLTRVLPTFVGGPRTLFLPHVDFPRPDAPLEQNLATLKGGYVTRNGDFFYYAVVWDALQRAFNYLNLIPGFSIPRDPENLGARRGLMVAALETTIRVYRCSNQSRIVGGKVKAEAIGRNGFLS